MKYLKRVTLKNFQSHKHSIIEFNKGLNIIVGPSDSGKSAIIRGIKWVLYNEPSGDYFIREGEREASVTLEFSNNITVRRLRSKSKNAYIILNKENEEIIFEGFGNKVPQEIIDLIGIEKVPLDTNESNAINLGEQLEGAFLLSEKGSTRASAIGRLVGVNLIDDALKDVLKDSRNISIQKKNISENIKSIEDELKTYDYLDELSENINRLEIIMESIRNKSNLKDKLIIALENYNSIQNNYKITNSVLEKLSTIDIIQSNIDNLEHKNRQLIIYKDLKYRLSESKELLSYNEKIVNKLSKNNLLHILVSKIEKLIDNVSVLNNINTNLLDYKNKIKETLYELKDLETLTEISINIDDIELKLRKLKDLLDMQENKRFLDKSINTGNNYLRSFQDLEKIDVLFKELNRLTRKIDEILILSNNLKSVTKEINQENKILHSTKNNINNNLKKYEELLKENETCPFCLSIINEDKINHIIQHYS